MNIRVATFNCENLFARYKFNKNVVPEQALRDGWLAAQRYFTIYDEESKKITAQVIKSLKANVLALQEVENLNVVKRFRNDYLGGRKAYPYTLLVGGNDPRLINVALLCDANCEPLHIRTYQHVWNNSWKDYLFSRDCLEVDIKTREAQVITLYINHFKSMYDQKEPCNGRRNNRYKRLAQATAVKEIVAARFGTNAGQNRFIILGDLNDYLATDKQGKTGIEELVLWDQIENVVERLPDEERWTHFYKGNKPCDIPPSYHQLDYILLSKSLAESNIGKPYIERQGLPLRAEKYSGRHFSDVGWDKPKASDHCPVVMELSLS